jgi:hypothetical protein
VISLPCSLRFPSIRLLPCPSLTEGHFLLISRESQRPIGRRYYNHADTAFQFETAADETALRQAELGRLEGNQTIKWS